MYNLYSLKSKLQVLIKRILKKFMTINKNKKWFNNLQYLFQLKKRTLYSKVINEEEVSERLPYIKTVSGKKYI